MDDWPISLWVVPDRFFLFFECLQITLKNTCLDARRIRVSFRTQLHLSVDKKDHRMEDIIFKTKWKKPAPFQNKKTKFKIPLIHNAFFMNI